MIHSNYEAMERNPLRRAFWTVYFVLLVLAESSFYFLNVFPSSLYSICSYHGKTLTTILTLVGIILIVFGGRTLSINKRAFPFKYEILVLAAVGIIVAFFSMLIYGLTPVQTLSTNYALICVPFLYFVLLSVFRWDSSLYKRFTTIVILICAIYAALSLLQAFAYSSGLVFMNMDYQYISQRGYGARLIMTGDIIAFGAVLTIGELLKPARKKSLLLIAALAIDVLELVLVAQTRVLIFGVILAALVGYYISASKGKALRGLLIIAFVIVYYLVGMQGLLDSLFSDNLIYSTTARIEAYQYYFNHMFDNGVIGIGVIPADSYMYDIYGSTYTRGGVSDIGILGFFSTFGMLGVVSFALIAIKLFRLLFASPACFEMMRRYPEAYVLTAFFFATSLTLALSNPQRVFFLPALLAIVSAAATSASAKQSMGTISL